MLPCSALPYGVPSGGHVPLIAGPVAAVQLLALPAGLGALRALGGFVGAVQAGLYGPEAPARLHPVGRENVVHPPREP